MVSYTHIRSPWRQLLLTSREGKLTGIFFADKEHARVAPEWVNQDDLAIFARTTQQLNEYAAGKRKQFDVPFAFSGGTPFQLKVWEQIAVIPFGKTITYGDIAQKIGSPAAVRAVGAATGANPIAIIVPCHRVIGKNGSLTGFAGGMDRKISLLDLEMGNSILQLTSA